MIKENKKLMSKAVLKRLEFIEKSQRTKTEQNIAEKLESFRSKIRSNRGKSDKSSWMDNKLQFPIDSANAFKVFEDKAKVTEDLPE
jgi:hypothetical protein